MWDLGRFEGVICVTLLVVVVFETEDSDGEGILGAEKMFQMKNPGWWSSLTRNLQILCD